MRSLLRASSAASQPTESGERLRLCGETASAYCTRALRPHVCATTMYLALTWWSRPVVTHGQIWRRVDCEQSRARIVRRADAV